jgi:hypothetical protein
MNMRNETQHSDAELLRDEPPAAGDTSPERVAPRSYSQHDENRGDSDTAGAQKLSLFDSSCAARVAELEAAIRALAEHDATLSVQSGSVIVTMDATLTDEERAAIRQAASDYAENDMDAGCWHMAATLRGLLERTKGGNY